MSTSPPKAMKKETTMDNKRPDKLVDEILAIQHLNEDMDQMNFEIKVRQLMRDLVEPLINKGRCDREMIFRIEKAEEGYARRIDVLEQAVYKKDGDGQPTLFSEMEARILEVQVDVKTSSQSLQAQIEEAKHRLFDQMFSLDARVMQIENYKEQLDQNRDATTSLQAMVEEVVLDLRSAVEKNLHKAITETSRLDTRINDITKMCDELPQKMVECESMCINASRLSQQLKDASEEVMKSSFSLDAKKLDVVEHARSAAQVQVQLQELERQHDQNANRTQELQSWIDIYMPLRFQHQLQETMKECLPRKGKHMLSVVSNQMCAQLRERMFDDVGDPRMLDRCLYVVKELQLEAETLAQENKKLIGEATAAYAAVEAGDAAGSESQQQKDQTKVLPRVDLQAGHMGDADSEALGKLQEELYATLESELANLRDEFKREIMKHDDTAEKRLEKISQSISTSHDSLLAFQNTLKDEMDYSGANNKKHNIESLGLIKGVSSSLKRMKEQQREHQENEQRIKDTLNWIVAHQRLLHQAVNPKLQVAAEGAADGYQEQLLRTSGGQSQVASRLSIAKQQSIMSTASIRQDHDEEGAAMKKAGDALKKLNIVMFRNKIGTHDPLKSMTNFLNASAVTKYSIQEQYEAQQSGRSTKINTLKAKDRTLSSIGEADGHGEGASKLQLHDGAHFERMEDLNSFLRDNLTLNQSEASLGHAIPTSSSPLKCKGKLLASGVAGDRKRQDTVVVPGAQMLGGHSINGEPADRELEALFTENLLQQNLTSGRPNETTTKKSKHTFAYQKHNSIVGTGRSSLVSGDSARFGDLSVNYLASEVLNPRLNQRHQTKHQTHHRNVTQSVLGHHEKPRGKAQRPGAQSISFGNSTSIRLSSVKYGSQPRAERIQAGRNSLVLTGASQLLPQI